MARNFKVKQVFYDLCTHLGLCVSPVEAKTKQAEYFYYIEEKRGKLCVLRACMSTRTFTAPTDYPVLDIKLEPEEMYYYLIGVTRGIKLQAVPEVELEHEY